MSATRAELVDAATDLNNVVLAPDDPIDVTLSVSEIRKGLKEAAKFVRPEDALQEATRRVLAEVAGTAPPEEDVAVDEVQKDAVVEDTQTEAEAASAEPEQAAEKPTARPRGRPRKDASASPAVAPKREKKATAAKEPGKAKKAEASKPAARTRAPRAERKLGEFRPVRAGTSLHKIVDGARDRLTVAQIASQAGLREDQVRHRLRHVLGVLHGIGYREDEKSGRLSLVLPQGKSPADAVRTAA